MSEPGTRTRPPPRVPCPSCRQPSVFAPSNRWRPFCSERCRMVDLGAWASESFRLPAEGPTDSGDGSGELPASEGKPRP